MSSNSNSTTTKSKITTNSKSSTLRSTDPPSSHVTVRNQRAATFSGKSQEMRSSGGPVPQTPSSSLRSTPSKPLPTPSEMPTPSASSRPTLQQIQTTEIFQETQIESSGPLYPVLPPTNSLTLNELSIAMHNPTPSVFEEPLDEISCEFSDYGCNVKVKLSNYRQHLIDFAQIHALLKERKENVDQPHPTMNPRLSTAVNPTLPNRDVKVTEEVSSVRVIETSIQESPASTSSTGLSNIFSFIESSAKSLITTANEKVIASTSNPFIIGTVAWVNSMIQSILVSSPTTTIPPIVKLALIFVIFWLLKGPVMAFIKMLILAFLCYTSYKYVEASHFMVKEETRPYALGAYALLVLYLMSVIL
jgi:hypothetical protein